jgi:glycosyltransferase involved in cell wall biosynthesis
VDSIFGIPVVRIPMRGLDTFNPKIIKHIVFSYKTMKEISANPVFEEYDIIHVHGLLHGGLICFFNSWFKIDKPIVVMIHGVYPHHVRPFSLSYYFEKPLLRQFSPDHVLLLDDGTDIERFSNFLSRSKIPFTIVYHGIDTDLFKPAGILSGEFELNQTDLFTIFFPHRPVRVKQPEIALKILHQLVITNPPISRKIKLIMLAGEDREELLTLVKELHLEEYVEILEEADINGMIRIYQCCDLVIGTSSESNLGRSIQEAMACEVPVIVFDCGGMHKIIHNGISGVLIENGNIEAFSEKILELLDDPEKRKTIGKNGRQSILINRNWQNRIKKELEAYSNTSGDS